MAIDAAAAGQGVVLAPTWLVKKDLAIGSLVHLFDAGNDSKRSLFLVHPEQVNSSEKIYVVSCFSKWLLSEVAVS